MTASAKKDNNVILSVKGVTNRFGKQVVHDGISFDVMRGEILGIVGGSGSGKSVLLKTMMGLRVPNKGKVLIEGKPVNKLVPSETAYLFGVLFQEGALFSSLSVKHNVMLPLREHTALPEEDQASIARFKLALTGLPPDAADKCPAELSGGMTKRAALARALAMDPFMLFLDEPTSGLDPLNAAAFDQLILRLNRSLNVTVVMVTHDLDSLFTVCDRAAVLVDGGAVVDTLPKLLKHGHPWIKEFLHGPRAQGAATAAEVAHGK